MGELNKHEALIIVNEFATLLSNYSGCEKTTIFTVGSLAEDDYRVDSSDIDVVVVTKDNTNLDKVHKIAKEVISVVKKRHQTDIEFEAFIKQKKEVFPPYEFGKNQTIEAMRLKKQAKLVKGEFNPEDIPIPKKEEFLKDAILRDKNMQMKNGEKFIDELSQKETINLILEYFRLELLISYQYTEFNKTKLIEEYYKRKLISANTYDILKRMRNKEAISDDELKRAKEIAKQKREGILNVAH